MSSVYFNPAVGGDGSTVTDDSSATTGLANGGHRTRFVPALSQTVAVAANTVAQATAAAASAVASAASAASALLAPGTNATSTTSLTIATGAQTLTLAQTGKSFAIGQYVQIVSLANPTNFMVGAITGFVSGTGVMNVSVTYVGGSGTLSSWGVVPTSPPQFAAVPRSARTSNTALAATDVGKLIDITSGTFTQTFSAVATLGYGWFCYIKNSGTGDITLDPSGSELIDSLSSYVMYPGEARLIQSDGTGFNSILLEGFYREFSSSGTFVKPPGYSAFFADVVSAGASGAAGSVTQGVGGGGGGRFKDVVPASILSSTTSVIVGAGGVWSSGAPTFVVAGGDSTFGPLTVKGAPATSGGTTSGNGGSVTGTTSSTSSTAFDFTGAPGSNGNQQGTSAVIGGGSGGFKTASSAGNNGGSSLFAAGGGGGNVPGSGYYGAGGKSGTLTVGGGGTANSSGAGGNGNAGANGLCGDGGGSGTTVGGNGGFPGGGGGGGLTGGGNGAAGVIRIGGAI